MVSEALDDLLSLDGSFMSTPTRGTETVKEDVKIAALAVKIPDFIHASPSLWYRQVQAQFVLAGVTREETQYYHVISRLPGDVLNNLNDIIDKDFSEGDYGTLKKTIIDRYSPSDEERVQRVLYEFRYDGGKPSSLFRQMIAAAASQVPYKLIVKRFSSIIPTVISSAIASLISEVIEKFDATETRDLNCETRMLSVADNMVRSSGNVHAISPNHDAGFNRGRGGYARGGYSRGGYNRGGYNRGSFSRGINNRGFFTRNFVQNMAPPANVPSSASNQPRFNPRGSLCRLHFKYGPNANSCVDKRRCQFRVNAAEASSPSSGNSPARRV